MAGVTPVSGPISQWISFKSDIQGDPNATTEYDYTQTFNLTNFNATTLALTGKFAVDNALLDIMINGHEVAGTTVIDSVAGGGSNWLSFNILSTSCGSGSNSCGLLAGMNTITFRTQNTVSSNTSAPNPTGLLVEFTSATADPIGVPEPATLFGVGLGLSILGLVYRRRRS